MVAQSMNTGRMPVPQLFFQLGGEEGGGFEADFAGVVAQAEDDEAVFAEAAEIERGEVAVGGGDALAVGVGGSVGEGFSGEGAAGEFEEGVGGGVGGRGFDRGDFAI